MKKRRMMEVFSPPMRKLWKEWELRAAAIISLLLQIALIILGKKRRHIPERWIRGFVWSFYLLADSVATLALGILSNDLGEIYEDGGKLDSYNELSAFWAPFFLLHLGGPDTITAYSLEDNELYLRHLFSLLVQTTVTGYILLMAWTASKVSVLCVPMILVGSIKYGERTWALWAASSDELQDSMLSSPGHGPNYAKLMDEYCLRQAEGFSVDIEEIKIENEDSVEKKIVAAAKQALPSHPAKQAPSPDPAKQAPSPDPAKQAPSPDPDSNLTTAYKVFHIFKRLFADLILSYQEQEESQSLFKKIKSADDAFDVIAIELGFVYDMLYTKATVIYSSSGIGSRIFTFAVTCAVLVIFSLDDLGKYKKVDVGITFLLLGGAIFLEIYAALTLILSDQSKRWLLEKNHTKILKAITCLEPCNVPRWSNRIGQYSLLSLFLNEKPHLRWLQKPRLRWLQKFGFRTLENNRFRLLERHGYKSLEEFKKGLKESIFGHVKKKYKKLLKKPGDPSHLRNLCWQRGKGIIEDYKNGKIHKELKLEDSVECDYDQSILIWHIATELCRTEDLGDRIKENLEMSQQISRYMLFLLAVYPFLLPAGIGLIRLRDTRAEAEKFFEERLPAPDTEKRSGSNEAPSDANEKSRKKACETLLHVKTHVSPIKVKGDRSKSVLFDACGLASELNKIRNKEVKWELIKDVWLDMLCFAANQCRGKEHAQQLRRGGELLTHVWLLMANLDIVEQFQISKGHSRALLHKE